ncbi:hypothetical protein Q8W71_17805 [Methylobacterium sp. NEAU 140]|uniref:hypothetical protein n=1 Tax=Methylobacterium sp. NEAU 140 TaxID=3064945 RepID=UPI0027335261|nr:hypothetical protein [Methylobacterium sp. NEAU 140]MDP4024483.1 hypothetical protein [Methylobacterium sp. NEAU 140]
MRSPFKHDVEHFAGGKGHSFRQLISLMPPHERYIETHLGGGAVMRRKLPARENVGIDVDARVIARWRSRRPATVAIVEGCVLDVLPRLNPSPHDLIYADPPYLPALRRTARLYRHDYNEEDHRKLLHLLLSLDAMVIVSGYRCELYDDLLANWIRTDYVASTHSGMVTESAWTNFTPGSLLHDYRFVGGTFRGRERFRRRSSALAERLRRADDTELNAALAVLAETRPSAVLAAAERVHS